MDAEQASQDCGWQFAGELKQGGGPGWTGMETDPVEAFGELEGADRLARSPAGEQPRGAVLAADSGVPLAGGEELADEIGERLGKDDGFAAQTKPYLVAIDLDVVDRQAG